MKKLLRNKVVSAIAVIFIMIFILAAFNASSIKGYAEDKYMQLQLFTKVLNLVQQYYVEDVDTKKLIYGGVKGMLKELDPHTNFLPPEIFKEFESETSGEFGGLGLEITIQKGVLTIISPIEDTPAWKAGLKAGDKIVTIDNHSTKGLSLVEAAQLMKGKNGTKVKLGIFREGFEEPKEFTVIRGIVKLKSVKYTDLEEGYMYIRLTSFMERSAQDMKHEVENHRKKYKNIRGLILDLRKNPGGLLDQAVDISDMFLKTGTIVSTIGRNTKAKEVIYAKDSGSEEDFPLIVLIDEYSASASEIVAGALRDNDRALIMGKRSFGKGSVQSVVKLGDGSGLKLTVARYFTPSGTSIQAEGIVPDVTIDNLDQSIIEKALIKQTVKREADIQGHLLGDKEKKAQKKKSQDQDPNVMQFWWNDENKPESQLTEKEKLLKNDFQILQAYNYLRAWKVMRGFKEK